MNEPGLPILLFASLIRERFAQSIVCGAWAVQQPVGGNSRNFFLNTLTSIFDR